MFERTRIRKLEMPIIQRDYAQGRPDEEAKRIRENFLGVLHGALTGGDPVTSTSSTARSLAAY